MEIYLRQRSVIVCLNTIALLLVFFVLGGVVGFVKAKVIKEEKYTSRESSIPPIQWHINKLTTTKPLPEVGEVCLVHLDKDGLYFVDR